ncbi:uncharacterized protein LOC135389562 [Ornithodoros turicata]|uniref:uncharacterized protein LOC135389562 n=1 Tax=Ornithodoros turicata TaxID=34597 RepID=UPI00313898FC
MSWYAGNKSSIRDVAGRFSIAHRVICFPENLEGLAQEFEKISGFPGVIGCIDGTFIPIRCPAHKPGVTYVNRHDTISLTLQGICDNRRRFLDVSTGFPSKIHDGRVLTLSNISKRLPSLCDGGRYHILGDAAYACWEYLISPYKDYGNLTEAQSTFNTKLSATRVLIENTFRILKQRFRQLKDVEFFSVERMRQLIMSCCVVHNLCIDANDLMEDSLQETQEDLDPGDGDVGEEQTALRTLGELKRQWLVNMVAQ